MGATKGNNTKQAAWVAIGSIASFGFSIVSSMILSRYFAKEDYGTYKQVMYVYNTLLFLFVMGLPRAYSYFIPRIAKEEGFSLVNKITKVFFVMGTFFSLILFIFSSQIADVLNNNSLDKAIKIFSITPFFLLPTLGIEAIYASVKKTYISSIYTVLSRIFILAFVVLPVIFMNGNLTTALIGFNISSFICFIVALYLKRLPFKDYETRKCTITYKEVFNFSIPLMVASLWGSLIKSSDQYFISHYFGTEVFADFSNGFMELPFVGMVVGACSTILLPVFSKIESEATSKDQIREKIYPIWISVFNKTALLIYPLLLFCWFYADQLMIILYGKLYETSAIYFRICQIANFFTLIAYAPLIMAIGRTKYYANVHMYSVFILILLELLAVHFVKTPIAIAVVSVLCHIGRIFAMIRLIASYLRIPILSLLPCKILFKIVFPSSVFLYLYTSNIHFNNSIVSLLVGFFVYVVFYSIYAYMVKLDYKSIILPILNRK